MSSLISINSSPLGTTSPQSAQAHMHLHTQTLHTLRIVFCNKNSCSAINPSKVHTHSSEHTPGAVGSHLCCSTRGAVGVQCLTQGLSHGIEGGESAAHSLPPPTIPAGPETQT